MSALPPKADIAEVDGQSALCQKRQQQYGYSIASSAREQYPQNFEVECFGRL
jgi:hypothetical protein